MTDMMSFVEVYNQTIQSFPTLKALCEHTLRQPQNSDSYLLGKSVILFSQYNAIPKDQRDTDRAEQLLLEFYQHWNQLCE